jgi:predicted nuclease of restriction endonuclease-like (RecB) superfamily
VSDDAQASLGVVLAIDRILTGYDDFLRDLKERVRAAQVRAALAVNSELVLLYWHIGRGILERQEREGWGAKVIDRLSRDLRHEFPEMKGFSARNLKYMRAFAQAWPDESFVQAPLAQITWYHNIALIEKLADPELRHWYAKAAIEFGWSRNVLALQIDSALHRRQGQSITNFARTLPDLDSDLAQNLLKDPYNFEFLTLDAAAHERDLERGLLIHLKDFMLELGVGFAFLGSQYHLEVGEEDFYLDLLFYHVKLHCYVVIDLKMGKFRPEYAGKLNFYLSAVDDLLREPGDASTIGLLLRPGSDGLVVEYALRDIQKPIGVSSFRITEALPAELRGSLPTVEQLEAEFEHWPTERAEG